MLLKLLGGADDPSAVFPWCLCTIRPVGFGARALGGMYPPLPGRGRTDGGSGEPRGGRPPGRGVVRNSENP